MRVVESSFALRMSGLIIAVGCLLGGGSRVGFLGDVVTQLLALPLLMVGLRNWSVKMTVDVRIRSVDVLIHVAMLVFVALLATQLVPWALRPGVLAGAPDLPIPSADAFAASGWFDFSATPAATWAAAMSLIPFFAVFFAVSQIEERGRYKLASLVMALGALALLVGFFQVLQGADSDLRFFEFTNPSEAVGFFANRNHFAAQLYTTLVFAAIWFAASARTLLTARRFDSYATLWVVALALFVVAVLAGLTIARSRAGVILGVAAIVGVAIIVAASRRKADPRDYGNARWIQRLVLSGLVLAMLFAAQYGVHHVLTRFEADPLDDYRVTLSPETLEIALGSAPFGSGLGSFSTVYGSREKLQHLFSGYANHAHNDWVEVFLESGIFSAVIAVLFLAWFGLRAVQIWRQLPVHCSDYHLMSQRGATLVIILLLAHSLVDYPLRTTAMSVLFAFACALLVPPSKNAASFAEDISLARVY
jgi:O-antigen ligase